MADQIACIVSLVVLVLGFGGVLSGVTASDARSFADLVLLMSAATLFMALVFLVGPRAEPKSPYSYRNIACASTLAGALVIGFLVFGTLMRHFPDDPADGIHWQFLAGILSGSATPLLLNRVLKLKIGSYLGSIADEE